MSASGLVSSVPSWCPSAGTHRLVPPVPLPFPLPSPISTLWSGSVLNINFASGQNTRTQLAASARHRGGFPASHISPCGEISSADLAPPEEPSLALPRAAGEALAVPHSWGDSLGRASVTCSWQSPVPEQTNPVGAGSPSQGRWCSLEVDLRKR